MLDKTIVNTFAHVKPGDTPWVVTGFALLPLSRPWHRRGDRRPGDRTVGQGCRRARTGTGWHRHTADFHIVIMLKGWARFMYEDKEHLVAAGDCVHQRPGIMHYLFDYSPDMEYLEVVGPADFGTVDMESTIPVPAPTPWKE